ncbi:MAG: POTRA domain-containing protein [Myxococcales bacterium]
MRRWFLLLFALWLGSFAPLQARADVPPEWLGQRVLEIKVVGEQAGRVDADKLGIPKGVPLTRGLLRDALERIGEAGRWADVQLDAMAVSGGVALLVHLTPRLLAKRIEFVGNKALENRELARIVGVREESELERELFPEFSRLIRESYEARGYFETRVQITLRDTDDPSAKVLRIEVDEGEPTRIEEIVFVGEPLPRRKGLRRVLGVHAGDIADRERIDEGLRKTEQTLREAGFYAAEFSDVRIVRRGLEARVTVRSRVEPHYEVEFRNPGPLSRSELFEAMALQEERLAGDANLRAAEQRLLDTYRRYGFRDASVTIEAVPRVEVIEFKGEHWEERSMVLQVSIEPGEQLVVVDFAFPGATHLETDVLREQMHSYLEEELSGSSLREPVDSEVADHIGMGGGAARTQRTVPKPIVRDPRRLYYGPAYDAALNHIRELYRADGFLDVALGTPSFEPAPDGTGKIAVIPITEGPRTFLYAVQIENNHELASAELLREAALVRDAPFSYLKLEEARLRMVSMYQEKGFFYAKVDPSVRMSDDGTRAEVTFHVEEGYVVMVGAVEVRGLDRSSRSMVLNRVRLKEGKPYQPSLARQTEDDLLALDIFTSITVSPEEPDLPARVKTVIISVTERKTQWLGWSAGFSTGEGVRGGFEYGYRNLFGHALTASFRGQIGYQFVFLDQQIQNRYESLTTQQRIEYQTTLTLGVPYIPHLPRTQANVDLTVLSDIQRDFRMQKQSVVTSFVYRPNKRWTFNLAEEIEESDFFLFVDQLKNALPTLQTSSLVPEGQNTLASSQFTFTWDRRDRAFNPHKGVLLSLTNEYAHTVNPQFQTIGRGDNMRRAKFESNMLRFMASFAFYIPFAPKLTFASQWRYGRIVHLSKDSQSYPNRRFYLGGTNFRGFNQNQMIPQDLEDNRENTTAIASRGGQTFIAGQNELRFPLVGDLYGGLFADVGNLWANPKNLDIRQLELVVGAGLRFQTPVASLAFDYGIRALDIAPFDIRGAFQFAFQTF